MLKNIIDRAQATLVEGYLLGRTVFGRVNNETLEQLCGVPLINGTP
jgi:hypothetical protein